MEPEQAGAVESPGALLSHRAGKRPVCMVCARFARFMHGLHGLFSGRKRRVTPTRRERVEQESPLLLFLACFPPSPWPLVRRPSQHPNKRGPMAPTGGLSRLRR